MWFAVDPRLGDSPDTNFVTKRTQLYVYICVYIKYIYIYFFNLADLSRELQPLSGYVFIPSQLKINTTKGSRMSLRPSRLMIQRWMEARSEKPWVLFWKDRKQSLHNHPSMTCGLRNTALNSSHTTAVFLQHHR